MSDCISRKAVHYYIESHINEIITESGVDKNEHTNRMLRALVNGVDTMPSVIPTGIGDILREIDIEETLSDDKPNTAWAIGYKQGLQTVRRIVERYKVGDNNEM